MLGAELWNVLTRCFIETIQATQQLCGNVGFTINASGAGAGAGASSVQSAAATPMSGMNTAQSSMVATKTSMGNMVSQASMTIATKGSTSPSSTVGSAPNAMSNASGQSGGAVGRSSDVSMAKVVLMLSVTCWVLASSLRF